MFNLKVLGISVLATALLVGLATFTVTHRLDNAKIDRLRADASDARTAAVVKALAEQKAMLNQQHEIALAAARLVHGVNGTIVAITNEVVRHVPVDVACPSVGFVRVLDAAASGAASVDDLPLPGGVTDGSCAPIDYRTLAKVIVGNYGLYRTLDARHTALATASAVKPTP